MFDGIHFTGSINLGNLAAALINLIGVIALYIRIKAKIKEHELQNKLPGGRRKDDPPLRPPPLSDNVGDKTNSSQNDQNQ